jgi:Predicted nucleic acid-binding protein, contains PIN domain
MYEDDAESARCALRRGKAGCRADGCLIDTHPKIMPRPAPTERAVEFVSTLLGAPSARWLPASGALWATFAQLAVGDTGLRGNLVPDAYLASAAIAHGARLATADRGFARYPGLNSFDPVGLAESTGTKQIGAEQ